MKQAVSEFDKAYKLASNTAPVVNMRKTNLGCFCEEHSRPKYILSSVSNDHLVICEECTSYFLNSVRNLMQKLGTVFPMSVYQIIAEIHLFEKTLIKVKDWEPEYFEKIRDLCCLTDLDRDHFNRLFKPRYMED